MNVPRESFMAATRLLAVLFFHCENVRNASKYSSSVCLWLLATAGMQQFNFSASCEALCSSGNLNAIYILAKMKGSCILGKYSMSVSVSRLPDFFVKILFNKDLNSVFPFFQLR